MEELLPLGAYHAHTDRIVRRMAGGAGAAGVAGSLFAGFWGFAMLRMRRADDELAHDNDPDLMGESLEHAFRYRMPCSLVDGPSAIAGTLYVDRGRAAFVPVRKLAAEVEKIEMPLGASPFRIAPWEEAPRRTQWLYGGVPPTLELVVAGGPTYRFLTPDAHHAMERLRAALPDGSD